MKVLFLSFAPVHKMHFTDMYITSIGEVFPYVVWDISMLGGGPDKENTEYPDILRIHDLPEFTRQLDALRAEGEQIVAISNILIYNLHIIYPALHERGIPVLQIDKESIIFWMKDQFLRDHPDQIPESEKSKYRWTANPLTNKVYRYLENQHVKFDYMLGARNYFPESSKRFVPIHNLKYDEYLRSTAEEPVLQEKYILFMDAGIAHLPAVSGKPDSINREEYLARMNHLFDCLEQKYGLPVVIAGHPKSEYPENAFNGRKYILYKTAALARYAEVVLCHYSTSIIDLVLQKKPIIFLYSEEYLQSASRTITITTMEYAKLLNAPLVELSGDADPSQGMDEAAYDRFIAENIVNESHKDSSNAVLITDFIKTLERS